MELQIDPNNYRIHTDKNKRLIRKSLQECGTGRSILFDSDDCIIAGNGVYEQSQALGLPVRIIESDGTELIAIKRTDLKTEDDRRKALALADNYTTDTSVFDYVAIMDDFSQEELDLWEFSVEDINIDDKIFGGKDDAARVGSLKDKFVIPPFSILDTRLGNWTERKRAWLALGIKSEVGRDTELTYSKSAQPPHVYKVKNQLREKNGVEPTWDEITDHCKQHNIPIMEGTSIFDPVLCELVYRWFNTEGGTILDPFAGGSVRGVVAVKLDMDYYGVELRKEQVDANYQNFREIFGKTGTDCIWACEDSRNIDRLFAKTEFDLLFTCPPYADLEVYSDDPRDLSNMSYPKFIKTYREIIKKSCDMLKDDSFAVFVVGEVRDKKGAYYNLVSDTIKAFQDCGLVYYNEMILVNQICSLAMRVARSFNNSRKIGKHHQNVLVFYKGDLSNIKTKYPALDFTDDDLFKEN